MTYEQLVAQPLFFNPQLTRGVPRRATREEEAEVLRWARAGVSRVRHVLAAGGARVATLEELLQAHPDLLTSQHPAGQLRLRLEGIAQELSRWEAKLAKGLPATLKKGEFRRDGKGTVWQTTAKVKVGEDSVPRCATRSTRTRGACGAPKRGAASRPTDRAANHAWSPRGSQDRRQSGGMRLRRRWRRRLTRTSHTRCWHPMARRPCRTRAP